MPKALFNIGFTMPSPPSYMKGQERADYIARRKFYNLTSDYNYFSYALNSEKVVKNKDAEHYFTREGSNTGLFDMDGAIDEEEAKKLRDELAKTKSIIWHGFISFDEETSVGFNSQENAIKFMKQTFNAFIDRTQLKRDNIRLFAALHDDTDHRHIHFAFYEKEPRRRDKNGNLCYTKKGVVDSKAIDNYLVSANMHLDEHGAEYWTARDRAMTALRSASMDVAAGKTSDQILNLELNKLIESLPKQGRLQYNSPNMKAARPQIDKVAMLLIASNPAAKEAHEAMLKELARVEMSVADLVKKNGLAYVNGKRIKKDEMTAIMSGKSATDVSYVDLNKVDYFDKLKADYQARIGNVVLGLCKDIKRGDLRDSKRKYGVNDKSKKIAARRRRGKRANAMRDVKNMLTELCRGQRADYIKTVQEIERENEFDSMRRIAQ